MIDASASILVCPDSLKETLSATAAAEAIAMGVRSAVPGARVRVTPLADGGEGTLEVLEGSTPGLEITEMEVPGPRPDRPLVQARVGVDPDRRSGVVELAEAAGLARLADADRNPERTGTEGVGRLLHAVLGRIRDTKVTEDAGGHGEVLLALGGSATVDGGLGALRALGIEVSGDGLDPRRSLVGGDLDRVRQVVVPEAVRRAWAGVSLRILADVRNPLSGPRGAAAIFGPQKGASAAGVERLDAGLSRWGDLLAARFGVDPGMEGAGAAGGIGLALAATLGGVIEPGFEVVAERVGLEAAIAGCDLVVTGEGCLDATSFGGKVVGGVLRLADRHGVPVLAIPGMVDEGLPADLRSRLRGIRSLVGEVGPERARGETAEALRAASASAIRALA